MSLHEPVFKGNEKQYLNECIDSGYVSSVGSFVNRFEEMIVEYTGANYAVAAVNGTSALHVALLLAGVEPGDEVITQVMTFVATANAISYTGASPVFLDVDEDTLGLSPDSLKEFLTLNTEMKEGVCINKLSGRPVRACLPMHTFGHPCRIEDILNLCKKYNIILIEDAAESIGSLYKGKHTGTFGLLGILSFNGNKTITTGGGGMIITNDELLAKKAKHITTTAKIPHKWEYAHDYTGFNYRLTNLAAALGCAQMERLPDFIESKRGIALQYQSFFSSFELRFIVEPPGARSNYWLNAVVLESKKQRDEFLKFTNNNGVMTRPVWRLMHKLPMYRRFYCGKLSNSEYFEERIVNIPSSPVL